jgi:competence ComEA-like helix-hairpin-helix protein
MKSFGLFILLLFIANSVNTWAQDTTSTKVRDQLEATFEEQEIDEESTNGEQLIQFLQDLAANPVNINTAGIPDLLQIPGITIITANAIVEYRRNKPFESVDELNVVAGIGTTTFQRMQPYITIGNNRELFGSLYTNLDYWTDRASFEYISRYQQVVEDQEGYVRPDSLGGYLGNPIKYYQRLRYKSTRASVNLTQEKDAGESLSGPTDFDYQSFHIAANDNGKLRQIVVGDYSISAAQGLVLWTGGAFGKGREVIKTISKNERGIRPYGSAQETNFFRGVAASYGERTRLSLFYSDRKRTASLASDSTINFPSSSGFHRTQNEVERRNNISQHVIGARFVQSSKFGLFGLSAHNTTFSMPIASGNSINDLYDFSGSSSSVVGIDYRGYFKSSSLFGEIAQSRNSALAGIIGVESGVGNSTDLAILYRNYAKDFQSIFGDGFGESSGNPQNEKGWYFGLKHQISNRLSGSFYFDQYQYLAPRNGVLSNSRGNDVLFLLEGNINRSLNAYILIRNEVKEVDLRGSDEFGREVLRTGVQRRSSLRIQAEYFANRTMRSRSRSEWVFAREPGELREQGFLLYQDLRWLPSKALTVDARYTLFDTDSFDSRVYQFENDLLYVLSNIALSDRGQRWYVVVKYAPTEFLDLSAKISRSIIADAFTLSSGLNEIEGNQRTNIGLQARLLFR